MVAADLISNIVPVLKREDTCLQALSWMELFRVSHLPLVEGNTYLGLVGDELIYSHGNLHDSLKVLPVRVEGTYVRADNHIYDVIRLVAAYKLSVVAVLDRRNSFLGTIMAMDIFKALNTLLCVGEPGGIIVLEINQADYSMAQVAQIIEYNEARILSCYVSHDKESRQLKLTLKVNTSHVDPLIDTFIRYGYTVKQSFVTGQEHEDSLRERYGLLMRYLSI